MKTFDCQNQFDEEFTVELAFVPRAGDLIYDIDRKQGHRVVRLTGISGVPGGPVLIVRSQYWDPPAAMVAAKQIVDGAIAKQKAEESA